jgi:hypothetical protein
MVMSTIITSKSSVSVFPQPLYGTETAFTSAERIFVSEVFRVAFHDADNC